MSKVERKKMILAMEFIARHINDERIFMSWSMGGIADGEFKRGEWDVDKVDDDYIEDDRYFAELMECFLRKMKAAEDDGGLYCDKVATGSSDLEGA